jgi:hypothetical protein
MRNTITKIISPCGDIRYNDESGVPLFALPDVFKLTGKSINVSTRKMGFVFADFGSSRQCRAFDKPKLIAYLKKTEHENAEILLDWVLLGKFEVIEEKPEPQPIQKTIKDVVIKKLQTRLGTVDYMDFDGVTWFSSEIWDLLGCDDSISHVPSMYKRIFYIGEKNYRTYYSVEGVYLACNSSQASDSGRIVISHAVASVRAVKLDGSIDTNGLINELKPQLALMGMSCIPAINGVRILPQEKTARFIGDADILLDVTKSDMLNVIKILNYFKGIK